MNIFARHGYPEEVVSDNGPEFISQEFKRFLSSKGIKHVRSSPYFPRSNGKIERFHRYLKKNFQAVTVEGRSWEEELPKILMSYRSIPHPMTGQTPAKLLFCREIRTELPSIDFNASESSSNVEEDVKSYQKRMKSYHDRKHRAKAHSFVVGDILYLARSRSDRNNKLKTKFDRVKYVIIEFIGRNTCKVVNTLDGKIYVRNVKHLTSAPIEGQALMFEDILDNEIDSPKLNNVQAKDNSENIIDNREESPSFNNVGGTYNSAKDVS